MRGRRRRGGRRLVEWRRQRRGGRGVNSTVVAPQAVTPAGATVGTAGTNGVQVNIPANTGLVQGSVRAVAHATVTSYNIGLYSVSNPPTPPVNENLAGSVFDIRSTAPNGKPDGGTFSQPVTISIQYPTTLTQNQLALAQIYYYDTTTSSWQSLPTNTSNTISGAISTSGTALTYYALYYPGGPPGTP